MRLSIAGWLLTIALSLAAHAQPSLASRVLVVYSSLDPDSLEVAQHYQAARNIPQSNMCAIPVETNATEIAPSDYVTQIKAPVQNCLTSVGATNILYIVLAWVRPIRIYDGQSIMLAVDSFLADIWDQYTTQYFTNSPTATHRYYFETQSQGNVFTPFQSLADFRAQGRYATIYSVWRLDGPSKALAEGLVDKALAAQSAGGLPPAADPFPNACMDMTLDPTTLGDSSYTAGNWDIWRAAQFLTASSAFTVVTDANNANFGTAPAPLTCPNTAIYEGWYNLGSYNDAFTWITGSFGWDLDSGGLLDPRAGVSWSSAAIQKGITTTSGSIWEPYLEGIPRPAGVTHDLMEGANVGDAFLRNTRWIKWRMINVGDPLYQPFPNKLPPFNAGDAAGSLSFSPRVAVPGSVSLGTITLSTPAPATMTVNLSVDQPYLNVPQTVSIPANATTATFTATGLPVTGATPVQIVQVSAVAASLSLKNTITVYPFLSGLGFAQTTFKGGGPLLSGVFLNGSSPLGGTTVQLSSDQPIIAPVPSSVVVPQGLSQVTFQIQTTAVGSNTTVNITASLAGATQTAQLTITP